MKKNLLIILIVAITTFIFIPSFLPVAESEKINELLKVVTFLFGIFIGFTISDRHRRLDDLRKNDSTERATLVHLYRLLRPFPNVHQERMQALIDKYLMSTMDYSIWDYYLTSPDFERLINAVLALTPKNNSQAAAYAAALRILERMGDVRNQTTSIIEDRLTPVEWGVFYSLAAAIVIAVFANNTGSLIPNIITILLVMTLLFLLTILHKLDSLRWKEEVRIFEPYQKTFEEIGLPAYYPQILIDEGRVKGHAKRVYRSATYLDLYPIMTNKQIVLVTDKNRGKVPTQKEAIKQASKK